MSDPEPVGERPTVFVQCDFAEVLNGKLYIMGAGIDRVIADVPMQLAIALLWHVPWDRTNQPHNLSIDLQTEDGQPFDDPEGKPVRVQGRIEVGRPPGMAHGEPISTPIAVRLPPLTFPSGGYVWRMSINNGEVQASAQFRAINTGGTS